MKYNDARATDPTVLLPMSQREALALRSLLVWALGNMEGPHQSLVDIEDVLGRLRKITPPPGPTIIKFP